MRIGSEGASRLLDLPRQCRVPQSPIRNVLSALLLLAAAASPAGAQGAQPLRKTDLVRLLTSPSTTKAEVAVRVRRNCLSFTPSTRDRAELRGVGATKAVMDAIDACLRPGGTLRLTGPGSVSATAGSEVAITTRLLRWDVPVAGVQLMLRGVSVIPGGTGQNPGALTDARGAATFHLLAGLRPGTYPLEAVPANGERLPRRPIRLVVRPAPVLRAEVRPGVVRLRRGERERATLEVVVRDAAGNPVPDVALALAGVTANLAPGLPGAVTDETGTARLELPANAVRREGEVAVVGAGVRLVTVAVMVQSVVISEVRTKFLSGTDQRGRVTDTLRAPLILEVRDTAGAPVRGFPVTVGVTNGRVEPRATTTDGQGRVQIVVTLGERVGPVAVTATVGEVTRQALLYATAGPPRSLVVQRAGRPVDSLVLTSRDSVVLQVATRDKFGNATLIEGLVVAINGSAVVERSRRTVLDPGTVVLAPRKSGSALMAVRASGLEQRIPVTVTLPAAPEGWVYGLRAGGAAFNYDFKAAPPPGVSGRPGGRGEVSLGRRLGPAFRVEGAVGFGVVRADAGGANLAVGLLQGLVRGEYSFVPDANVQPVLSLGGGVYRLKSTDRANLVYHTSLFFTVAAGVDYVLGPRITGEARVERQQLLEANSKYVNGAVGALTLLEIGVRVHP